jgi:DNA (cytosine-5)-methyltransferase 1
LLLSLFCGAGGLDLGFEGTGFDVGLAFDRNVDSVKSYNSNRVGAEVGYVADVSALTLADLDRYYGSTFKPTGVVGGPPCQSFSQANVRQYDADPRHQMPIAYANLLSSLNQRAPVDFFVLENVVGLTAKRHGSVLAETRQLLEAAGFTVEQAILDAQHYDTPQTRRRLFLVGFNKNTTMGLRWEPPARSLKSPPTVRETIERLPVPTFFTRGLNADDFTLHPNHWCMQPKSPKFGREGALTEGRRESRSFKTLAWDEPSIAVAYGHREVHVHPTGKRRLSVFEAMLLQGFPTNFRLHGSMSSQIRQVSEAVPVPLARAVAHSISQQISAIAQAA